MYFIENRYHTSPIDDWGAIPGPILLNVMMNWWLRGDSRTHFVKRYDDNEIIGLSFILQRCPIFWTRNKLLSASVISHLNIIPTMCILYFASNYTGFQYIVSTPENLAAFQEVFNPLVWGFILHFVIIT